MRTKIKDQPVYGWTAYTTATGKFIITQDGGNGGVFGHPSLAAAVDALRSHFNVTFRA
jgi:hypothetical protein